MKTNLKKKILISLTCINAFILSGCISIFEQPSEENSSKNEKTVEVSKETGKTEKQEENNTKKENPNNQKKGPARDESNPSNSGESNNNSSKSSSMQGAKMDIDSVQIQMPHYVQKTNYYCVPATLQMVLQLHGITADQNQLAKEMNTSSSTGTEYIDLTKTANTYLFDTDDVEPSGAGYRIQRVEKNDTSKETSDLFEKRVRQDMSTNDPVFVAAEANTLNPNLAHGNHMVLITGYGLYSGTDNIAYYYYIDPADGELNTITPEQLMKAIAVNEEPAYIW